MHVAWRVRLSPGNSSPVEIRGALLYLWPRPLFTPFLLPSSSLCCVHTHTHTHGTALGNFRYGMQETARHVTS